MHKIKLYYINLAYKVELVSRRVSRRITGDDSSRVRKVCHYVRKVNPGFNK